MHKIQNYFLKHKNYKKYEIKILNQITLKISCENNYECYTAYPGKYYHIIIRKIIIFLLHREINGRTFEQSLNSLCPYMVN